jgi:hypothetical protein
VVARGGKNCGARGHRDEVPLQDYDLHAERHRTDDVRKISGERHDVDVFASPDQPVVVGQSIVQIRGHQDAHAPIVP